MKGTIMANALSSYCRNAKVVYWPDENVASNETYMTSFFKYDLELNIDLYFINIL